MCYTIFISTTSDEDFNVSPSERLRFERVSEEDDPAIVALLYHPSKWYLTREFGGCSCHFRHDAGVRSLTGESAVSFEPPQDWCPEDSDNIEATIAVYEVFKRIVAAGHQLDVVDAWNDTMPEVEEIVRVALSEVPADYFRFFENRKFVVYA